jgi:hypothetical protein
MAAQAHVLSAYSVDLSYKISQASSMVSKKVKVNSSAPLQEPEQSAFLYLDPRIPLPFQQVDASRGLVWDYVSMPGSFSSFVLYPLLRYMYMYECYKCSRETERFSKIKVKPLITKWRRGRCQKCDNCSRDSKQDPRLDITRTMLAVRTTDARVKV